MLAWLGVKRKSEIVFMTYCICLKHGVLSEEEIRIGLLLKSRVNKLRVTSERNNAFLPFVAVLIKRVCICVYMPTYMHVHVSSPLCAKF